MSFELVKLGEVAKFIRGVSYKPNDLVENFSENSIVCMRTANVQKKLDETDMLSIPLTIVKDKTKYLQEGDILVSTANSWNLVGKCSWIPKLEYLATAGGFISILRADDKKIDRRYLYHWFNSDRTQIQARNCGRQTTNISNMDLDRALSLKIPLPPLSEQKRIADILDKADELRQKRQQSIEKLDELLQATFIDMFGDPVTNPKEWEKETIEKVCKQVIDCPHSTPKWTESGEICLRTSNLGKGEWIWDDTRYIDTVQFEERTRRSKLFTGDIVLSREGTIGIAAIVEKDMNLSLGQRLVQLTPNTEIILSEFLLQVLLYDLDPIRITRLMVGSTSKHINVKDLRNLKIFIPPLELQEKWTVFSNKLRQQKQVLKKQLAQQENLFQSLQQRAFNGEL